MHGAGSSAQVLVLEGLQEYLLAASSCSPKGLHGLLILVTACRHAAAFDHSLKPAPKTSDLGLRTGTFASVAILIKSWGLRLDLEYPEQGVPGHALSLAI